MNRKVVTLAVVGVMALALTGCAYKPLKAPCSPDDGGAPLSYAEPNSTPVPEPFRAQGTCGPIKPI